MNFLGFLVRDEHGQDLIEYALMTGFVAVAAGAIMPGVGTSLRTIYDRITGAFIPGESPDVSIIRIICALLAVVFLGLLILRRKGEVE